MKRQQTEEKEGLSLHLFDLPKDMLLTILLKCEPIDVFHWTQTCRAIFLLVKQNLIPIKRCMCRKMIEWEKRFLGVDRNKTYYLGHTYSKGHNTTWENKRIPFEEDDMWWENGMYIHRSFLDGKLHGECSIQCQHGEITHYSAIYEHGNWVYDEIYIPKSKIWYKRCIIL